MATITAETVTSDQARMHYQRQLTDERQLFFDLSMNDLDTVTYIPTARDHILSVAETGISQEIDSRKAPLPTQQLLMYLYDGLQYANRKETKRTLGLINKLLVATGIVTLAPEHEARLIPNDYFSCAKAETYFARFVWQILAQTECDQEEVRVIHDANNIATVVQKQKEQPTGLTLQSLWLPTSVKNGNTGAPSVVHIPPGCIVAVGDLPGDHETGVLNTEQLTCSTWFTGSIPVRPLRLSPWAYESRLDRAMFAFTDKSTGQAYDTERADMITRTSLQDFRLAAQHIINMCMNEPESPR